MPFKSSLRPITTEGVSVVVLTRNSAADLPALFKCLAASEVLEVLVCDRNSTDDTTTIARENGTHIFRSGENVAEAVNGACKQARGTALWFLSPQSRPVQYSAHYILDVLDDKKYVGGTFPLRIGELGFGKWLSIKVAIAFTNNFYLAQTPFISHLVFDIIGGYPETEKPLSDMMLKAGEAGGLLALTKNMIGG